MFLSLGRIESAMKSLLREGIPAGRVDDLKPGTLVNGCYRIQEFIERRKARCLYTVTLVYTGESDRFCGLNVGKQALYRQHCEVDLPARPFQMEVRQGWLDPVLVRRLLTLSDPKIAPIYDVFTLEGYTYVISEHVDGVTLDRMEGTLTTKQIRMAGIYLSETVESLHQHGIYGMDLEFSNLRIIDERLRLMSLSTSRTVGALSQGDAVSAQQEDLRRLLDTLERLAAEYGAMGQSDDLGEVLLAIEDVVTQNRVSSRDIQEAFKHGQA